LSIPQTGRMIVTGGGSFGGASSRAGRRQRMMAMAMLPKWAAKANPQKAHAVQSANVIINR
jgi:hypothetical protein